jgi:hypothetical protein
VSTDLQLVAVDGDIEAGTKFVLSPDEPLTIGRSAKGLRLPDPLVSIHHARIEHERGRGYVVVDLESATGTWVDEECIKGESRPIGVGTRLRFGDSTFEVTQSRLYPVWVSWVMAATLLFGIICVAFVIYLRAQPDVVPALQWREPIRQGATSSEILVVPDHFARARGLAVHDLRIRRVTDYDYDGVDEVWLRDGTDAEYVISFESDGSWREMGDLPAECHDKSNAMPGAPVDGFPALDCANVHYVLVGDRYRQAGHDGVVVWARARRKADDGADHGAEPGDAPQARPDDAPLQVMRVVLKDASRLAGFLAERAVTESVHYVVCEDAFPGLRAQALTASGELRPLGIGCLGSFKLTGVDDLRVVAVALTAGGREALLDDVTTFYAGAPDGLFLDGDKVALMEAAGAEPGFQRGGVKLTLDDHAVFVNPVAHEADLPATRTSLPANRAKASPPATTALIETPGAAKLEGPSCAELVVRTGPFACEGLCSSATTFLTVEEVGCGQPQQVLSVGYGGGVVDGTVRGVDVRAVVEATGGRVLRARLTYRASQE